MNDKFTLPTRLKDYRVLLALICLISTLALCWNVYNKEGWHIDEKWSYMYTNGSVLTANTGTGIEGGFNTWYSADVMREAFSVQDIERFNYSNITNYTDGASPPLYYLWLHTVGSFFPDYGGKWLGLIANIPFYLMTILSLFGICDIIFKSKKVALVICAYWALSLGGISAGMYFRFYCMLTGLTTLSMYAMTRLWFRERSDLKTYVLLAVSVLVAELVHYYYWPFILIAVLVFVLFDICYYKTLRKTAVKVFVSVASATLVLIILHPRPFLEFIGVDISNTLITGQSSVLSSSLLSPESFKHIVNELSTIIIRNFTSDQWFVFNNISIIITFILLIVVIIVIIYNILKRSADIDSKQTKIFDKRSVFWIVSLGCIALFQGMVVAVIDYDVAPHQTERYFWYLMPIIAVVLGAVCMKLYAVIVGKFEKSARIIIPVFSIIACLLSVKSAFGLEPWLLMRNNSMQLDSKYNDSYIFIAANNSIDRCGFTMPYPNFKEYYSLHLPAANIADRIVYEIEEHIPDGAQVIIADATYNEQNGVNSESALARFSERGYSVKVTGNYESTSSIPYELLQVTKTADVTNTFYVFDDDKQLPDSGVSFNYPSTPGMAGNYGVTGGYLDLDGAWITSYDIGLDLYGPYAQCREGVYNFTLHYEVLDNPDGLDIVGGFDICTAWGEKVPANIGMPADKTSVTLEHVAFDNPSEQFENRLWLKGAKLKIISFEIERVG